jgi:hypothetical protein
MALATNLYTGLCANVWLLPAAVKSLPSNTCVIDSSALLHQRSTPLVFGGSCCWMVPVCAVQNTVIT